jgi:vesicle-associated membrane protein 7
VVDNGLIFLCAADTEFGRTQPYAYLNEMVKRFNESSLATRAQFATDGEFDRDFQQVMTGQMDRYSKPEQTDNISKLHAQVEEVKGVMTQNIEKVLERGEKLDDLIEQTNQLEAHSHSFQKAARKVHRKMWCKNMKMKVCMVVGGLVGLTILIVIILFSTGVLPPSSDGGGSTTTTTAKPPVGN